MSRFVALLRGINVGGHARVPMAELRAACAARGLGEVRTYIQSGNIVGEADDKPEAIERAVEALIRETFDLQIPVIVRTADQWGALAGANPFPEESASAPNRVMACLAKRPLAPGADEALQARARDGETVRLSAGALWVHYPESAGTSKLTPALFDRLAGSPVTARNWRTVTMLRDMTAGLARPSG